MKYDVVIPRVENWFVGDCDMLFGEVYGHPLFKDGEIIRTSRVVELKDGKVYTKNSVYLLGEPLI